MDYYSTLGVSRNANQDEIKKAYRSMAMKHHPDRGGDEKKFKEIEEAYRTLSDPQKKQMFDMGVNPNTQNNPGGGFYQQGPFEFRWGSDNFDDMFNQFGFGRRPMKRNKTLNIVIDITLEDVLNGKDINAEITLPGTTQKKIVNITVPPGIEHGQQIRYEGMGDNSVPGTRPGDLIVNVRIAPHPVFVRDGSNIIIEKRISVWDALLGSKLDVITLDKKTLTINVPAGSQPDTILSCRHEGLPLIRNRQRGNLLIKLKVEIPKNLTQDQKDLIEKFRENTNV